MPGYAVTSCDGWSLAGIPRYEGPNLCLSARKK